MLSFVSGHCNQRGAGILGEDTVGSGLASQRSISGSNEYYFNSYCYRCCNCYASIVCWRRFRPAVCCNFHTGVARIVAIAVFLSLAQITDTQPTLRLLPLSARYLSPLPCSLLSCLSLGKTHGILRNYYLV